MRRRNYLWAIVALLLLSLLITASAQAAVVGQFTQVEGQVDLLKQGKIPAAAAKVRDGVEPGDVIRTKSKSKAQMKFVDDSVVTMAPESRMAVADFTYDAATGKRRAVLRFFKGVLHTVVSRVLKVQEPDFLMETHTAVIGVRGTEEYTVLLPNATGAYLISGLLEVRSNNPKILEVVRMNGGEFTTISLSQPPGMPQKITPAMLELLKTMMQTGLKENAFLGAGIGAPTVPEIPSVLGFRMGPEKYLQMQPIIPPRVTPPVLTRPAPPAHPTQVTPSPSPSPGERR